MGNSPYEYAGDNPILNIDMNGDSVIVSKTITENKTVNKAFNAFASTKAGRKFLGKYAAKGQTIGGYTYTKSGKYNDKGIDVNYGAKNLGDNTVGGQTDESVAKNGRAEIDVTINTQTRDGIKSSADDFFDKSSSFIHESFLHVNMDTQDFLDNGKFDNSNIDPSIRNNPLINKGDWQHIQVLQDYSKRGYYPGSSWPLEGIRALQEVNQNNNSGRTPGQILQQIWYYHGGLNLDTNGKVQ